MFIMELHLEQYKSWIAILHFKRIRLLTKLYEFCQFLENGNMAWSQEETLDIIRNMIVEYGGTL